LGAKLHAEESVLNPLLTAIFKGNVGIAKILIDAGVDLTATYGSKKDDWWDALSYARYRGQTIIAKMIEEKLKEQGIEFEPYVYEDEVIITREEDEEIPEYEQDGNVYIAPYIQAKLGKIVKDIPELFPVADKVTVNIHVVKPRNNNDFIALVTNGMSGDAMAYTEDGYKYAEVMIKLPPDWKTDENLFVDPKYSWPITILRKVAYLPHLHKNHYIDESTIIPFGHPGEPPVPFTEGTKLSSVMLIKSREIPKYIYNEEISLTFYTLVPIAPEEEKLVRELASEKVVGMLESKDIVDLNRKLLVKDR